MLSWFPDAGPDRGASYMPGTSGCSFLRQAMSERGHCAKTVRILGLDGESAGGKGQEVTLGLAGDVGLCRLMWFYCMERGGLGDWICLTGADFAISRKICSYYSEH